MSKDIERDRSVEGLLKATRPPVQQAAASPACLEAGLIASWAASTLAPEEATRVEAHLAECVRCQAVLAAFARAEPPAPRAVPFWSRWTVLLPAAAATAAVALLWIVWPQRQAPAAPVVTVAEAPHAAEPAPQPARVPTPPPAARSDAVSATKPIAAPAIASPVFRAIGPPPATPVPLQPPPPAAPLPSASGQAAAKAVVVGESPLTDQRLSAPGGVLFRSSVTAQPIAAFDSPRSIDGVAGGAAAGVGGGRGGGGSLRPNAALETANPATVTRWRILPSRDLERSTDDGRTWERVAIDPPPLLTNGAAPSRLVCWLVGRAGVVLVTNDASHFTRLAFPEAVDLSAVRATDALNATVTTADGRVFVTTDAGKTWSERRLQRVPASLTARSR